MHPYKSRPSESFWRKFVSETAWRDLDLVGATKFELNSDSRVSTAGSCFAQHISRHMRRRGLSPFQTEFPHPLAVSAGEDVSSYQTFSARFGNVYSSRQCLELMQQAFGLRPAIRDFCQEAGRVYDLLRPNILPRGFLYVEEAQADRLFHLRRVREMFEKSDVFIFTLGLTETWYNLSGDYTYPVCPGTARGIFDPQVHRFRNLTHSEVVSDLHALMTTLRNFNPRIKVIITVSPVPLVATYTSQNVLVASTYSKSILRGACGELCDIYDYAQYFPSFEIISHAASFGQYLQGDLREVTERGVSHVMDCFFKAFYRDQSAPPCGGNATAGTQMPDVQSMLNAECEEMFNEPVSKARAGIANVVALKQRPLRNDHADIRQNVFGDLLRYEIECL